MCDDRDHDDDGGDDDDDDDGDDDDHSDGDDWGVQSHGPYSLCADVSL